MSPIAPLIRAIDQADSAPSLVAAVQALAATKSVEGVPTLITALGYNNPGAAVAAVDGLIQIGEPAVQPLLELLDGYNYSARAWAIRAIAGIGDPRGLPVLQTAAADFALSVRRAAARGLGTVRWELLPMDQVRSPQEEAATTLMQVAQDDPEWVVRYAAITGLDALANWLCERAIASDPLVEKIVAHLQRFSGQDDDLTVRTRAQWAIHQLH